jgi:hypothetical protein
MKRAIWAVVAPVAFVGAVAACTRQDRLVVVERGPMTYGQAADALADALCARAERCGDIGDDDDFETVGECLSKQAADVSEHIDADECPRGIDGNDLDGCLARIAGSDCDDTPDLAELSSCDESRICYDD